MGAGKLLLSERGEQALQLGLPGFLVGEFLALTILTYRRCSSKTRVAQVSAIERKAAEIHESALMRPQHYAAARAASGQALARDGKAGAGRRCGWATRVTVPRKPRLDLAASGAETSG